MFRLRGSSAGESNGLRLRKTRVRMAVNTVFKLLLVFISAFGFVFAFITVRSVMSFLSIIPSSKVDAVQIRGN